MDTNERLERLETKLAYQEAALMDLSQIVLEYRSRVDKLEDAARASAKKIAELMEDKGPGMPHDQKPPHY